ncbi:WD and tetratricopeptide repeats protein 1, partial [Stegodyphus mimosarum]
MYPKGACLFGNRAAAYIKRGWDGDYYAAIRDCHAAIKLNPEYLKAHFRLAQCLHKLRWMKEAMDCIQAFKLKFPDYARTRAFESFEADVKIAVFAEMEIARNHTESEDEASAAASTSSSTSQQHSNPANKALPSC